MRHSVTLSVAFLCAVIVVNAQHNGQREKTRSVLVPREVTLVTVAFQPDCPLQFEKVKALAYLDGGGALSYQLRNVGTKSIRSFTIAERNSAGTGKTWSWEAITKDELALPQQLVSLEPVESRVEIVLLTDDLRKDLKLQGKMRSVVVLMVVRVEYVDGSIYSDEGASKALDDYLDKVGSKMH
jgi:hypothetical protein